MRPMLPNLKIVNLSGPALGFPPLKWPFLAWTRLVGSGQLTLSDLVRLMSARPAQLLGLERGSLIPGYLADILVFDPTTERAVDPSTFYSKGKNCPYTGEQLSGWPVHVLRAGKPILQDGKIIERSETV